MDTLAHFSEAFAEGNIAAASKISTTSLEHAIINHDHRLEAEARWHLSRVLVVSGDLQASLTESKRALELFEVCDDHAGQVRSLISISYAAGHLRHGSLSLAAGASAERLSRECCEPLLRLMALSYLGQSLFWSGNAAAANDAFSVAVTLASGIGPDAELHPLLNRATGEAIRLVTEQVIDRTAPNPAQLESWIDDIRARNMAVQLPFFSLNSKSDIQAAIAVMRGFAACWRGDFTLV
jgi:hypothetical protein